MWNKLLWGVEFSSPRSKPHLIGSAWRDECRTRAYYAGEPTRAMLFTTRSAARAWCAEQHARYAGRTDCCATWGFRAVRVRETVRVMR